MMYTLNKRNGHCRSTSTPVKVPTMMSIREVASTGVMTESSIRLLVKQGKVPHVMCGKKALINFELFCERLNDPTFLYNN